ncbi:MAG TPA: hypothetical protein VFS66_09510 [Acidimicrobiia bacterium]|nr:hypothetical protein [Acidimicrobiia bacterium]
MPHRNRVDPFGDLHAVPARGMFTGNRGCLVDENHELVRHHRGDLWITCVLEYEDWRHPLDEPGIWTPLFFLDEAVALAAGHRPCGFCRRPEYLQYQKAVAGSGPVPSAIDLNRMLARERLRRGRGLERGSDRILWEAELSDLPSGTLIVIDGQAHLVNGDTVASFGFDGWGESTPGPTRRVDVLTPPTSVGALQNGYQPVLHESAGRLKSKEPG